MPSGDAENVDTREAAGPKNKPIRIGLIADTQIPRDARILPPHVKEALKDVDLILHAGDIYLPRVLDELETIAPVLAARGNGDKNFPRDPRLKDNHVLEIAGLNLGLTHMMNYPVSPVYSFDKEMESKFGKRMDIIIFGDTHVATVEEYDGILLVNPGSPTLPDLRFELGTVGLLEITENRPRAHIVRLSDFPLPFHRELIYYRGRGA